MFFSAELLSKRDSGFGLLWLAATLGSKSSFKKLPKRSIQTADIPQLCNLISHPSEPLALRLSSNLMVGVARVYKIKHEIFMADVSNCFVLLKKAVQEIHALGAATEAQLQMGQPTVRRDALTLATDPTVAVAFDLDIFEANWDDLVGLATQRQDEHEDDEEYTPNNSKSKSKSKSKQSLIPSETGRAAPHTLDENHEHLLSTSFDGNASFLGGMDPTSSQIDPAMHFGSYAFDDNIFGPDDQLDLGLNDIGDDLARELGEGWGVAVQGTIEPAPMDLDEPYGFPMDAGVDFGPFESLNEIDRLSTHDGRMKIPVSRKRNHPDSDKENVPPGSNQNGAFTPHSILTSAGRDSNIGQVIDQLPEAADVAGHDAIRPTKKAKKVRLLLDARTELTDEELKAARQKYTEGQRAIRIELERKRYEKEGEKALEDMIWGVPYGLTAPALANFWSEIFKIQVESRSGVLHLEEQHEPEPKRRKTTHVSPAKQANIGLGAQDLTNNDFQPTGLGDYDFGFMQGDYDAPLIYDDPGRLRSSEEPEHGRDRAHHASADLGLDIDMFNPSSGTQRSALFPWDNAADLGTSSSAGAGFAPLGDKASDRLSLDKADVRLERSRSRSASRRGSFSIVPSQAGSLSGLNFGLSPGHGSGNDFRFDLTNDKAVQETHETENNLVTLERTSYNFLEYCKMQLQTSSSSHNILSFADIVPSVTSSRRVAAAAFHHCLVLATKDLITVHQAEAYSPITMRVK